MPSARSANTYIDASAVTVLGLCPLCDHREFGHEEAAVRRGLLTHFYRDHDEDEARQVRDTQRRWFHRRGVAA